MVSSQRKANAKARSRRMAARALIANVNAARATTAVQPTAQPHSSQPSNEAHRANQVVHRTDDVPVEEFNPLPHGPVVRTRIVRSEGVDPNWPIKLVLFYHCWWSVSFHRISGSYLNL